MLVRDADTQELMDDATTPPKDMDEVLANLRTINALLGWTRYTVRQVSRHVRAQGLRSFSLLDIASGSADMPLAIARWARRQGIAARFVVTDVSPVIVSLEREQAAGAPEVTVERQNALALPYPDASFDFALCTLALHHFPPDAAVQVLRNMGRVARRVLVFDLERSLLAYLGALALTRGLLMHPITRHDGPVSVRRAYSEPELREMAARAGLRDVKTRVHFPFRLALDAPGGLSINGTDAP
jgi:SAM-dependent methyltransferase